jgi:hypothetical protein
MSGVLNISIMCTFVAPVLDNVDRLTGAPVPAPDIHRQEHSIIVALCSYARAHMHVKRFRCQEQDSADMP